MHAILTLPIKIQRKSWHERLVKKYDSNTKKTVDYMGRYCTVVADMAASLSKRKHRHLGIVLIMSINCF